MFSLLGKIITRGWPIFLGGWVFLLALVSWTAPPWRTIAEDREFGFLPQDTPGRQGEALFRRAFPRELPGSNVVFVLHRDAGKLLDGDFIFIDKVLKPGLMQIAEEEGGLALQNPDQSSSDSQANLGSPPGQSTISKIITAMDPGAGPLLISGDRQATLVVVELTTEFLELRNLSTLRKLENLLGKLRQGQKVPPGLAIHVTGSATVGRDINRARSRARRPPKSGRSCWWLACSC